MFLKNKEILEKAKIDNYFMEQLLDSVEAEKFIKYVIKSFTKNPARFMQQHQVEWEDLYQASLLGLFNGIKKLNLELSPNEWVRYVYLSIQGEIRSFSRSNNSNSIGVSQRIRAMYPKYLVFYRKYRDKFLQDPTIEETMMEFNISRNDAFDLVYGMQQVVSIFQSISDGENDNLTIGYLLADPLVNVEKVAINKVLIETYMGKLKKKQRAILYMHFYLGLTKTEIAGIIGCGNSMVHKHIENAFKIIREIEQQKKAVN